MVSNETIDPSSKHEDLPRVRGDDGSVGKAVLMTRLREINVGRARIMSLLSK